MNQPEPKKGLDGAFIVGIVLGLLVGGTILTLIVYAGALLVSAGSAPLTYAITFGIAVGLGVWGTILARKYLGFGSGIVIGLAAGLLGGAAVCAGAVNGLSNMH